MTTVFRTARLTARELIDDDIEHLQAVYGDAEAMRWVDDGQPISHAECVAWVGVTQSNYARRGYGMWALLLGGEEPPVGFLGIVHPGGREQPEVKYALRRARWGQGLASEAVAGAVAHARDELGLAELIATLSPDNLASRRVLAKAGFFEVATRIDEDGSAELLMRLDLRRAGA